jgi:hypothetical protein
MEHDTVNNKYVVGEKLGGKFGVVHSAQTQDEHARRDKVCGQRRRTESNEATILNYLYRRSVEHVPFVIWYGMDACPNRTNPAGLIMPKYDCSLTDYAASVDAVPATSHRRAQIDGGAILTCSNCTPSS